MGLVGLVITHTALAAPVQLPCPRAAHPVQYMIEHAREPALGPGSGRLVIRRVADLELDGTALLRWRIGPRELVEGPEGAAEALRLDQQDTRPLQIVWRIDPSYAITGIDNLDEVRAAMDGLLPAPVLADPAALAALLARDVGPLLSLACAGIDPDGPTRRTVSVPSPVGLTPLPAQLSLSLTGQDASTMRVEQILTLDPDAARRVLGEVTRSLGLEGGLPPLDITETGAWTLDRTTGWPTRIAIVRAVSAIGEQRTDRTTYTRVIATSPSGATSPP
ncbi:MAG: hypothetical protein ACI8PZ_000580 [Myxococcota bacterium]|jgi:hypothetical protein